MDNTLDNIAKKVKKWREDRDMRSFSWPAQSPDMNPIENSWCKIVQLIAQSREG